MLLITGALTTLALPLGDPPANASESAYHRNAHDMRAYINNSPVAGLLTGLLVVRTEVSMLRPVPGSCEGGTDAALSNYTDVVADLTDYSIWAVPIQTYRTTCAGLMIARD